jgi:predicted nucleic acid-binding Zn ribbon protein
VAELKPKRSCTTCGRPWDRDTFYANCGECKDCKRKRSRNNRAVQARKIAAFERFADALVNLADRATEPPAECRTSLTGDVA